jgi:membrane-associated phospholipid phosphatase
MTSIAAAPTVPLLRAPARRGGPGRAVAAVLALVLGAALVAGSYVLGVLDRSGRAVDDRVLRDAFELGLRREALELFGVGIPALVVVAVVLAGFALARGRVARVVSAVALVLGAELLTQVLKAGLVRPDSLDDNSLPSGHVTFIAALGAAVVLVVPRVFRPLAAVTALAVTGVAGVAVMLAGWHRPSDVVAALGVVVATAGVVTLAGALLRGRSRPRSASPSRAA